MIVLQHSTEEAASVTMWLRPNRSLSRRGLRRLIIALTGLVLTTAGLGAWQGNVFAPLFALVESSAVALALNVAWRGGARGERIHLDSTLLEVRHLPGRGRTSLQSYWVRVRLRPEHGRHRLLLRSHGRELEIGAFLAEPERLELSRKLMVLLEATRTQPRR